MKRFIIVLLGFTLLLPLAAEAAYKIYLKNGSVISGASSYEKEGDEIKLQIGGGSMSIPAKDVLKIEKTDVPEKDFRSGGTPEKQGEPLAPSAAPTTEAVQSSRADTLKKELESVDAELKSVEERETELTEAIKAKQGERTRYDTFQLKKVHEELAPMREELSSVQQRKSDLLQHKAELEGELKALQ